MDLPARLKAIADYVPLGSKIVDVGTDHAMLPVYLIKNKIAISAVAADLNQGPLEAAKRNIKKWGLDDKIKLRLGNGLENISENEYNVIIIAGMGGGTIRDILNSSFNKAATADRLILQPMGDSGTLRIWLVNNGWKIADELLVKEDNRIYEIICAEIGDEKEKNKELVSIGPRLHEKKDPLFMEIISAEINNLKRITSSLECSDTDSSREKKIQLLARIDFLESVIQCL